MKRALTVLLFVFVFFVSFADFVAAQRPAVDVRHVPNTERNVLPADFTADGRTDLIGVLRTPTNTFELVVWRGNGDGTFSSPIPSGMDATPLATGRFNADTRFDAIVMNNTNGTFATPRPIGSFGGEIPFVFAHDFNGDSRRDLIVVRGVTEEESARVFALAGNGDGTFAPAVELPPPGPLAIAALAEDLNGDGRRDFAIAANHSSVTVYLNQGGLLFPASQQAVPRGVTDIAAADVNRDRRLDLIATQGNVFTDQAEATGIEVLHGGASVSTAGPAVTAPVWLRLVRSGDVISAYVRRFTTFDDNPNQGWPLIGRQQFTGLPPRLSAMLVSSSHVDGTLATGNFESTRVVREPILQSIDIGTTAAGRTGSDGTTVTMEGDGADIWGTWTRSASTTRAGAATARSSRASAASRTRTRGRRPA